MKEKKERLSDRWMKSSKPSKDYPEPAKSSKRNSIGKTDESEEPEYDVRDDIKEIEIVLRSIKQSLETTNDRLNILEKDSVKVDELSLDIINSIGHDTAMVHENVKLIYDAIKKFLGSMTELRNSLGEQVFEDKVKSLLVGVNNAVATIDNHVRNIDQKGHDYNQQIMTVRREEK